MFIDLNNIIAAIVFAAGMDCLNKQGSNALLTKSLICNSLPEIEGANDAHINLYAFTRGEGNTVEFGLHTFFPEDARGCCDPECCGANPYYTWNSKSVQVMHIIAPENMSELHRNMWYASSEDKAGIIYDLATEQERQLLFKNIGGYGKARKRAITLTFGKKKQAANYY